MKIYRLSPESNKRPSNIMITSILKYIKTLTLDLFNYVIYMPDYIRGIHTRAVFFINDQKVKFRDILTTNIELGKHHLFLGRISDASFRFRAAHFLFDTQNKEINYWLGWCYFFKHNYDTAIAYLEDSKEYDKDHLINFIKTCDTSSSVPEALWSIMHRISTTECDDSRYYVQTKSRNVDLPLEFIRCCMNNIQNIEPGAEILDYGSGSGLIGSTIDRIIASEYKILAIENNDIFVDYIRQITGDRGLIYDDVIEESLYDAHNKLDDEKYDLITSFDSIIFTKNLESYLQSFYKALSKNGHLAILLPLGSKTGWSKHNKSFVFDESDAETQLNLAEFNILDIKKWKLSPDRSFIGFICTKRARNSLASTT